MNSQRHHGSQSQFMLFSTQRCRGLVSARSHKQEEDFVMYFANSDTPPTLIILGPISYTSAISVAAVLSLHEFSPLQKSSLVINVIVNSSLNLFNHCLFLSNAFKYGVVVSLIESAYSNSSLSRLFALYNSIEKKLKHSCEKFQDIVDVVILSKIF